MTIFTRQQLRNAITSWKTSKHGDATTTSANYQILGQIGV